MKKYIKYIGLFLCLAIAAYAGAIYFNIPLRKINYLPNEEVRKLILNGDIWCEDFDWNTSTCNQILYLDNSRQNPNMQKGFVIIKGYKVSALIELQFSEEGFCTLIDDEFLKSLNIYKPSNNEPKITDYDELVAKEVEEKMKNAIIESVSKNSDNRHCYKYEIAGKKDGRTLIREYDFVDGKLKSTTKYLNFMLFPRDYDGLKLRESR